MQGVLADVSIATGYVTIVLMLGGRFVFQWFGWQVAAATTPVLMLIRWAASCCAAPAHWGCSPAALLAFPGLQPTPSTL